MERSLAKIDIAIIGAGASGLCAAIEAKCYAPWLNIVLFEKGHRPGKKILASGNGRCNMSNRNLSVRNYHGQDTGFVAHALDVFGPKSTADFFLKMGVPMREDGGDGRLFPYSFTSSSVIDALRHEISHLEITLKTDCEVINVAKLTNEFTLKFTDCEGTKNVSARAVIVACGGAASPSLGGCDGGYEILRNLGHEITPLLPSIVQLKTDAEVTKAMDGLRLDCVAKTDGLQHRGEVLFTKYGLSGPAILQLSGECVKQLADGKNPIISLNLLPEMSKESVINELFQRRENRPWISLEDFLSGLFHKRIAITAIKSAGIIPLSRTAEALSAFEIKTLADRLQDWRFAITGDCGLANAQVTSGGAKTAKFSPDTLESLIVPGLFACGEVLDIDGDCGGYNLQWAWSSGRLAGESASKFTNSL